MPGAGFVPEPLGFKNATYASNPRSNHCIYAESPRPDTYYYVIGAFTEVSSFTTVVDFNTRKECDSQ